MSCYRVTEVPKAWQQRHGTKNTRSTRQVPIRQEPDGVGHHSRPRQGHHSRPNKHTRGAQHGKTKAKPGNGATKGPHATPAPTQTQQPPPTVNPSRPGRRQAATAVHEGRAGPTQSASREAAAHPHVPAQRWVETGRRPPRPAPQECPDSSAHQRQDNPTGRASGRRSEQGRGGGQALRGNQDTTASAKRKTKNQNKYSPSERAPQKLRKKRGKKRREGKKKKRQGRRTEGWGNGSMEAKKGGREGGGERGGKEIER